MAAPLLAAHHVWPANPADHRRPAPAGKLWQLDGRRAGPVCHGPTTPDSLLGDAARVVKEFVDR